MDSHHSQGLDSPSRNSYIGSYYQPPDRVLPIPRIPDFALGASAGPQVPETRPNIQSRAVLEALQTLQGKIKQLEKERQETENRYQQVTHASQRIQPLAATHAVNTPTPSRDAQNVKASKKELDSKLQAAESRCQVLGKQLEYMKNMVENVKAEKKAVMENQATVQKRESSSRNSPTHRDKLKKLEAECLKLSKTQSRAEVKLTLLEQRLLKEEHERKVVQEKASELQRDLDLTLQLVSPKEPKQKKQTEKPNLRTCGKRDFDSPSRLRHQQMPFVAGTSTSPSHSVHANVQGILHLMKHHQPHLCERISALQRPSSAAKKNLQKHFSSHDRSEPEQTVQSLESLSDILLALQDELGRMSFEHQELVSQMESTVNQEQRGELQRELEMLAKRMEEKGAHITKLRQHGQTVLTLKEGSGQRQCNSEVQKRRTPVPSPFGPKQSKKSGLATQKNLQILRETQKLRSCLKQDDLLWET
ncbi:centrosomal protein CEP57L1 isoform X1 [Synchiropus splendidus]|uniref:centrosomal protein CEP57L1 isoform X1 n=1 Tax=Synchiropus splendidus TaxID=270530 RepID=UPI00237D5AE0|nr:centrosomal protein CEP57L1 isoform X1 [Synchiropus splendidus]